jgi:hypothetical protein
MLKIFSEENYLTFSTNKDRKKPEKHAYKN